MADSYQAPPHSIEAEQAVLGGLMLDNKTWHLLADQIRAEDFYRSDHRLIFKAISELADRGDPFDVITISEALEGMPASTNLAYIAELARNTPSVANIEAYARVVSDQGHLRQLISIGHDQIRIASQPNASAQDAHEQCEKALFALGQHSSKVDFTPIAEVLGKVIDQIDRNFNSGEMLRYPGL